MIERIEDLPDGILGLQARGKVTRDDYLQVVEPYLAEARSRGGRYRIMLRFGPDLESFAPLAMWEDFRIGMRYTRLFERCAVVSDTPWIRVVSRVWRAVMPLRVFADAEYDAALAWLRAPAETPPLEHELLPGRGVLVLRPRGKLRSSDFDAVEAEVDAWIEEHGRLDGLVVHVPAFPGWETIGSFLRHFTFVRDHHKKIRRVAIAADGKVAELGVASVGQFVSAEVRRFPYAEFAHALDWAAGDVEGV